MALTFQHSHSPRSSDSDVDVSDTSGQRTLTPNGESELNAQVSPSTAESYKIADRVPRDRAQTTRRQQLSQIDSDLSSSLRSLLLAQVLELDQERGSALYIIHLPRPPTVPPLQFLQRKLDLRTP